MKKVTVLRKWNNPMIEISVTSEDIQLSMSLRDFLIALTDEVAEPLVSEIAKDSGNPAMLFTTAQLEKKLVAAIESEKAQALFQAAADKIIDAVKMETNKIA